LYINIFNNTQYLLCNRSLLGDNKASVLCKIQIYKCDWYTNRERKVWHPRCVCIIRNKRDVTRWQTTSITTKPKQLQLGIFYNKSYRRIISNGDVSYKKRRTLITEGGRILASLKVPRQSQVFLLAKTGSSPIINVTSPPKCIPINSIKIPA